MIPIGATNISWTTPRSSDTTNLEVDSIYQQPPPHAITTNTKRYLVRERLERDGEENSFTADGVSASQLIVSAGYPIGIASAIHLGYRSISALADDYNINGASTGSSFDLSATLLSVGIQFGF